MPSGMKGFQVGHKNYLTSHSVETRLSISEKLREWYKNNASKLKGRKRDDATRKKISRAMKQVRLDESKHPCWTGDNASSDAIHQWLIKNFGKANRCENKDCTHKSRSYDWANINNHQYRRHRHDFMMLCRSCHLKLDYMNGRNKR